VGELKEGDCDEERAAHQKHELPSHHARFRAQTIVQGSNFVPHFGLVEVLTILAEDPKEDEWTQVEDRDDSE